MSARYFTASTKDITNHWKYDPEGCLLWPGKGGANQEREDQEKDFTGTQAASAAVIISLCLFIGWFTIKKSNRLPNYFTLSKR